MEGSANYFAFLKGIFEVSYKVFNSHTFDPKMLSLKIYIYTDIHIHTWNICCNIVYNS